ncbi:MAG TPA: MEDS domain-containing protein [Nitrosopumilaceae archaeon]|nr:MEDS domain-containing protein [Nitrosopumilaceae archaeon]
MPIKFIDSVNSKKHIALLYEDSEYARMLEFRFLKNGLEKGEQCVYATEGDSGSIVLKMLGYGIPLEHFESKKLRVYQIHQSYRSRDEIMKSCKKDIEMILSGLQSPFRIVSRIVPDVSTIDGMSVELELERETHRRFDDIGGSVMCPYDLSKIESSQRKEWIAELAKNHHEVIYASRFGEGEVVSTTPETK